MNFSGLKASSSKLLARTVANTKLHSPELLTVAGVVGIVAATVLAARATLKLEDRVVIPAQDALHELNDAYERGDIVQKDLGGVKAKIYVRAAGNTIRLYGPSGTLLLLSLTSVVCANGILKKRNVALIGAYKALEESYSGYRGRVKEILGEEKERDVYLNLKEEEVINPVTGKKEKVKVPGDPNTFSPYARIFDEGNYNWTTNAEKNLFWLRGQQNYLNDLLQAKGWVTLNDFYDACGFEQTTAGQLVGWTIGEAGDTDGYIDFGMYEARNARFINGEERSVILDPNVDGMIVDEIDFFGERAAEIRRGARK